MLLDHECDSFTQSVIVRQRLDFRHEREVCEGGRVEVVDFREGRVGCGKERQGQVLRDLRIAKSSASSLRS